MGKPNLSSILRILISLFLLALLLWLARDNFTKIWQLISSINIAVFALAFLIFMLGVVLMAWRLQVILAGQDAFLFLRDLFPLTLIGYFFTNFMPTSVGGDLVKAHYISKKNSRRLSAYTSVFVDRVIGMFSVALIATIALLITREVTGHRFIFWSIIFLLGSCSLFALSLFQKSLLKKISSALGLMRLAQLLSIDLPIKKAYGALAIYTTRKDLIAKALVLSVVAQFIAFGAIFFLAKSLMVYLSFARILLVMPVIFVLCMLPVTMNGLGLREWGFVLFLAPAIGEAAALSLSLLYLAIFLLASLIGGIIYLFWRE